MIILGIDPGTAITGYGIVEFIGNRFKVIDYGKILTSNDLPLATRLKKIYFKLEDLIEKYKPEHLVVEELFFNKNTRTALSVGHARGIILLAGAIHNMPTFEYTPLQVKQAVVGYGRAEKKQVQEMVRIILNLEKIPKPDDVADALAITICHAHSYKLNKLIFKED
ncbi:MAG: crossover junction endodeoxyribonuclease RuvC [Zhaonellaceae bacterium]|jgi:crossover junction endodeoxyribonuclease RuvC|nr:crossover junction endodeoxyribonuclease RuvC [Clostridia bacterium]